jgi:hypothetical protein
MLGDAVGAASLPHDRLSVDWDFVIVIVVLSIYAWWCCFFFLRPRKIIIGRRSRQARSAILI